MLLDEPLGALDLKLRQQLRAELRAIQKRTNVTFIYITHDQGEALAMSDRVAVMSRGKIQQVDVPQKIYNSPANGFVASFVGENNKFTGTLSGLAKGQGKFKTNVGEFAVTLGERCFQGFEEPPLYPAPEHVNFIAKPKAGSNAIPVTIEDAVLRRQFRHGAYARQGQPQKLSARSAQRSGQSAAGCWIVHQHHLRPGQGAGAQHDSEAVAYAEKEE